MMVNPKPSKNIFKPELNYFQERKLAGDIYINNLLTDLKTAEAEGAELQKEFDWILTLPPSAFASQEMLDWLRLQEGGVKLGDDGDTDSELGLELDRTRTRHPAGQLPGTVLLPDQVHPSPDQARYRHYMTMNISHSWRRPKLVPSPG